MLLVPLQSLDVSGYRCGIYIKHTTRRNIPQGFFHPAIAEAFGDLKRAREIFEAEADSRDLPLG